MKRLLLLAPLLVLLSGCILYPGQPAGPVDQNAENLGGVRFWQQQAVEGFDGSTYHLSDAQVDEFRDLLVAHDVDPGDYDAPDVDCDGGIVTRVQMWFHDNGDKEMIIDGCSPDDGSFEQEATQFFSNIRTG
jgi:hypothetical protein